MLTVWLHVLHLNRAEEDDKTGGKCDLCRLHSCSHIINELPSHITNRTESIAHVTSEEELALFLGSASCCKNLRPPSDPRSFWSWCATCRMNSEYLGICRVYLSDKKPITGNKPLKIQSNLCPCHNLLCWHHLSPGHQQYSKAWAQTPSNVPKELFTRLLYFTIHWKRSSLQFHSILHNHYIDVFEI